MRSALVAYVALTVLTLGVFALWPELDLIVARYFFHAGSFFGGDEDLRFAREFFRVTPFVVLAAYAALWLARRSGVKLPWAPSGRAVIFLIATIAIGPGLIVNLGLKDHWGRPRPYQTQGFSGQDPFRPWYATDGACKRNCSFVSGEAATAFWTVAPASLLPPPWRAPATRRRLRLRSRREPAQAGVRRPLSQRRPARRAPHPHRHRGRPAAHLAARRVVLMDAARTGCAVVVMGVRGAERRLSRNLPRQRARLAVRRGRPAASCGQCREDAAGDSADRRRPRPWLDRIGEELKSWAAEGRSGVLTCSALKRAYRDRIRSARPDVRFVYVKRLGGADREPRRRAASRIHAGLAAAQPVRGARGAGAGRAGRHRRRRPIRRGRGRRRHRRARAGSREPSRREPGCAPLTRLYKSR